MAELHLVVPDSYIAEVRKSLSLISGDNTAMSVTDIGREALGVYRWMLNEMARGNAVTSMGGGEMKGAGGTLLPSSGPIVQQQIFTPGTAQAHSEASETE